MATPKPSNFDSKTSDRHLLQEFLTQRDEAPFRLLVARHSRLVWIVCRRMLSCQQDREDVFQATFLKLLMHADRKTWHETLGGWLHKVAYRLSLDVCAGRSREQAMELAEEPAIESDCLEQIQRQDAERALHAAIAQLPQRDRQAIVLCYFQNKSREEAAAEMGCSLEALRGLLKRGRQRLHVQLACRGLSCSLALVTLEGSLSAATTTLPQLVEKTVLVGFNHPAGGGTVSGSPRVENLFQVKFSSLVQSTMATHILATAICYSAFFGGGFGWLQYGAFSNVNAMAPLTALFARQGQAGEQLVETASIAMASQDEAAAKPSVLSDKQQEEERLKERIAKLIRALNDPDSAVREAAVKSLNRIGLSAQAQLKTAAAGKNRSLAKRAELILLQIQRQEEQREREALWSKFKKTVGDTEESRLLFDDMHESERALFKAYSQGAPNTAAILDERCRYQFELIRERKTQLASVVGLLWVLGELDCPPEDLFHAISRLFFKARNGGFVYTLSPYFQELADDSPEKEILRKLIKKWLSKPRCSDSIVILPTEFLCKSDVAWGLDMKKERLSLAVQFLRQNQELITRLSDCGELYPYDEAAFVVCHSEDRSLLHLLSPFLENESRLVNKHSNHFKAQVRDIIFPAALYLTDQSLEEYGLTDIDPSKGSDGYADAEARGYIFPDDKARDAAFAKWRAWLKENPVEKAEQQAK